MIKLLWNTHNHKKTITDDIKIKKKEAVEFKWGIYHKKNSNIWVHEVLKKIEYKIIENEQNVEKSDILIVVDSNPEKKIQLYNKLKLNCSKIFLLHLGDESGAHNLPQVYKNFNYVWRTFCSNKYFNNNKIKCIPIGYKSGVIFNEKSSSMHPFDPANVPPPISNDGSVKLR